MDCLFSGCLHDALATPEHQEGQDEGLCGTVIQRSPGSSECVTNLWDYLAYAVARELFDQLSCLGKKLAISTHMHLSQWQSRFPGFRPMS